MSLLCNVPRTRGLGLLHRRGSHLKKKSKFADVILDFEGHARRTNIWQREEGQDGVSHLDEPRGATTSPR